MILSTPRLSAPAWKVAARQTEVMLLQKQKLSVLGTPPELGQCFCILLILEEGECMHRAVFGADQPPKNQVLTPG